jgi:DNA-directed RNA polymerase
MYTAIECDKLGIYFAAVHDSYWTHAADVEVLHDVLRK